jgi:hypothetical protein
MIKKLLLFVLIVGSALSASAQEKGKFIAQKKRKICDATIYGNIGMYNGSYWGTGVKTNYLWGVGKRRQNFRVGVGLRSYFYKASRREYTTSSVDAIENMIGGADSLYFPKLRSFTVNPYISMQVKVKRGIDFGVNLDLGGITFGSTKIAYFHSYELTYSQQKRVNMQPYGFNLSPLVNGGQSYGSSMMEAYFRFNADKRHSYQLGANYFINEVTTKIPITGNGKLFKSNNYLIMAGMTFNLRWHQSAYDANMAY